MELVPQFGVCTPIWNWYPDLELVPQYGIPKYVLQISIDAPIWKPKVTGTQHGTLIWYPNFN